MMSTWDSARALELADTSENANELARMLPRAVVEAVSVPFFSSEDHKDWRRLQTALAAYDAHTAANRDSSDERP